MTAVVRVEDLHKSYSDNHVVRGVSFEVARGEVVAVLGPNGAGKSTTIEMLEGYRDRDSGTVEVLGVDPADGGAPFRDRIGIVLQSTGIDEELTVREAIDILRIAYSNPASTGELIDLVDLVEKADARIDTLSGGQQRRVDLALGLVGNPELLFLDEPTTGFDPAARRQSWDVIRGLTAKGTTIVLTTHYLEEASELADRVIVLANGGIVAQGTPDELTASFAQDTRIRFALPAGVDAPIGEVLAPLHGTASGRNGMIEVRTATPTADLAHLTGWAQRQGIELAQLTVSSTTLEDVYLELVGGEDEPTELAEVSR